MKEKLVELISRVQDCGCDFTDVVQTIYINNDELADYLISQGVIIQEKDREEDETVEEFEGEYAFLSNFFPSPIYYDGIIYPTNEHFFQAMKTTDMQLKKAIANAKTPGEAKRLGRNVTLRPDWEKIKEYFMELGLRIKFEDPILRKRLLNTGTAQLVEGNWWHDNEWGNCTCEKCKNQKGKNKLGVCLMKVRAELSEEKKR